ncbi:uncharacterized protein Dana_GF17715 [Drosophila ananassae]|uniref:Uncharacterized protein n=1 Tax=Drosophila ananassae TaxID=7217 RepID=B3LZI8_DROAN|nr:uncharacterized protein LOC6500498 [Drosophila ananassae]EDV41930.1 uncharacterized protein Dana_GF17715 [Drosophila ananassae]
MSSPVKNRSVSKGLKVANQAPHVLSEVPVTFNVTQLDSHGLCSGRGVQLPPLMTKGQIRPEQVANARFRLLDPHSKALSDQQFNALIKRLVKCFMSEVAITKKLRKLTAHPIPSHPRPTGGDMIRHLETLRRNYEAERSDLVVKLSLDNRFNAAGVRSASSYKKSRSLNLYPKRKETTLVTTPDEPHCPDIRHACSKKRQAGGSLVAGPTNGPISVRNNIVTPSRLSQKLQAKLNRLKRCRELTVEADEMSLPTTTETSMTSTNEVPQTGPVQSTSETDVFYDMATVAMDTF